MDVGLGKYTVHPLDLKGFHLGGGNSKHFLEFSPRFIGEMESNLTHKYVSRWGEWGKTTN